ncbi:DNA cytosine methyltransferase [Macromonas nakdongensis]|uniref:DNA cytosine methyltransferase n=1 Tax=Macromonas nakdongensis TaxID=1843082 RepID=UPI000C34FE0D|nr:DNA cytosine methyltransferase [Macromonas nakdongensis]
MTAYYNEIDPAAAQWLRNLIAAGHIAPGYVDERSIEDVYPSDLRGFTQCHFFAGIGVWSHALRSAGWGDDRPVWTGSCPCQPFSAAGKGAGFDDERHLWPAFHHLIKECKPATVIGEQVASKDADPWINLVHTDLEALGYAFGAVPFPSAGVGAPHIRDRLYWVGHASRQGLAQRECIAGFPGGATGRNQGQTTERTGVHIGGLAHHDCDGRQPGREGGQALGHGQTAGADCGAGGLADDQSCGRREERQDAGRCAVGNGEKGIAAGLEHGDSDCRPGPTNGFWRDADWLFCRDGKWRPVEPSTFPLAHGAPARVVRLRAYGNAINAKAAQAFIECVMEAA